MNWDFLDIMDKNLLYMYAKSLTEENKKANYQALVNSMVQTEEEIRKEYETAEERRKSAFYIIWFVYRYVLECRTLEEAERYSDEETLRKYKLIAFLKRRFIYIGVYGLNEIYLYKYNEGDMNIVLEILYGRYDLFEMLECYMRRTEGTGRSTRNRCIKITKEYLEMMKDKPEYAEILQKRKARLQGK